MVRTRPTVRALMLLLVSLLACAPSAGAAPSARVGAVDCDAGGAVVTLTNDGGAPVRFVVTRDGTQVASVVLAAGALPAARVVPVAEGASALVAVTYGGTSTSGLVKRGCEAAPVGTTATAGASSAPQAGVGPAPTPVVPATGTRGALDAVTAPGGGVREAAATDTAATKEASDRTATADEGATPAADEPARWPAAVFILIAILALGAGGLVWLGGARQRPADRGRSARART